MFTFLSIHIFYVNKTLYTHRVNNIFSRIHKKLIQVSFLSNLNERENEGIFLFHNMFYNHKFAPFNLFACTHSHIPVKVWNNNFFKKISSHWLVISPDHTMMTGICSSRLFFCELMYLYFHFHFGVFVGSHEVPMVYNLVL